MDLLLAVGDTLDIVLEGGWRRTATVTAIDAPHVDLRFSGDAAVLPAGLSWCAADIEWTPESGSPTRTSGIVHLIDGAVRLEVTCGTGIVQRRQHQRVPASVHVEVSDGERHVHTRTLDVSAGGMLLGAIDDLPEGRPISFTLDLGDLVVTGTGTVVRRTAEGDLGVRFNEPGGAIVEAIDRLITTSAV